jgi:hypothetical protein
MSTYAGINIQRAEYHESIDYSPAIRKTALVPKRSELLRTATGRTSHRVGLALAPVMVSARTKFFKEKPMFRTFSIMTLLGLATISAAYAQSGQPIQAKVPFAFTVQDTILPAGNYQLTYSNTAHRLFIRGLDQNSPGAFVTAEPASAPSSSSSSAKLVFDCYGKTCYLARAWQGSIGGGRGLKVPQTEREHRLGVATRVVSITIPAK